MASIAIAIEAIHDLNYWSFKTCESAIRSSTLGKCHNPLHKKHRKPRLAYQLSRRYSDSRCENLHQKSVL